MLSVADTCRTEQALLGSGIPARIPDVTQAPRTGMTRLSRVELEPLTVELVVSFWPPSIVAICSPYRTRAAPSVVS